MSPRTSRLRCVVMLILAITWAPVPAPALGRVPLTERVFTWACVFHATPPQKLAASMAGMLVVDPDNLTASDVAIIRAGGKLVLAYLSVGETEAYRRSYKAPGVASLTIRENPQWKGNFLIEFRAPRWREVLEATAEEILAKGFDGFFLDTVDVYRQFPDPRAARGDMVRLIAGLCGRIRERAPDSYVILQNSLDLFEEAQVFEAVDGINQEGLFHTWLEKPRSASRTREKIRGLDELRRRGKFVSILEYTRKPLQIAVTKKIALRHGFIPYFSTKELGTLFPIP